MNHKLTFLLVFLLGCFSAKGQGEFGHSSPETANFIRYGEVPVSLYTGTVNFDIPVYTINDRDFEKSISLVYTSDGFMFERRSGTVGLNWFLNAGGVITREVYGVPDDFEKYQDGNSYYMGLWEASKRINYTKDDIYNFKHTKCPDNPYSHCVELKLQNEDYKDFQPDLFRFNFGGYSGRFMCTPEGEIICDIPGVKIDLSELGTQYYTNGGNTINGSRIKITTPDGYIYHFGGDSIKLSDYVNFDDLTTDEMIDEFLDELNSIDSDYYWISASQNVPENLEFSQTITQDNKIIRPVISAWHLNKIVAPNGRVLLFSYMYYTKQVSMNGSYTIPLHLDPDYKGNTTSLDVTYGYQILSYPVLRKIEIPDRELIIDFSYSGMGDSDRFYDYNGYYPLKKHGGSFSTPSSYDRLGVQLDAVNITHKGTNKRTFRFEYEKKEKWRFLSSFYEEGMSKYSFSYNHGNYPVISKITDVYDCTSGNTDFWGYLNTGRLLGSLKKISYPTGGYTELTFEDHDYSKRVEINLDNYNYYQDYSPSLNENVVINSTDYTKVGGIRIKTIKSVSKAGEKEIIKNYSYKEGSQKSSGTLLLYPPFAFFSIGKGYFQYDPSWKNYNVREPHIGYSEVTERYGDGSSIVYKFTDYKSNPDEIGSPNFKICHPGSLSRENIFIYASRQVNWTSSKSHKRGLLKEKVISNANDEIISDEHLYYRGVSPSISGGSNTSTNTAPYGVFYMGLKGGCFTKKIYLKTHPLIYKKTTTDNVTEEDFFEYNDYDFLSQKKKKYYNKVGAGQELVANYQYIADINATTDHYLWIKKQNLLNALVSEKMYQNNTLTSTKKINYSPIEKEFFNIESIETAKGNNSLETRIKHPTYDIYGNPLVKEEDGIITVYLWSYKGQQLIGEIKGSTFDAVNSAVKSVFQIDPYALSVQLTPNETKLVDGSLQRALSGALVTTYTYTPSGKLKTVTGTTGGDVLYYEYDSNDRLKLIKDASGQVIEEYQYNYQGN